MRKLTLAKETLRILDDEDLARVVGGDHKDSHKPNSGSNGSSCPAKHHTDHKKDHHSNPH
jgi:hypothetical protein